MGLHLVVLAAGLGKRMYSKTPKVLHTLAGKPLLRWVLETAMTLNPEGIHVVYGHGGERVKEVMADMPLHWVYQEEQLGTGHALLQAMPAIPDDATVLVLYGDVPLTEVATLHDLIACSKGQLSLLTAHLPDPTGFGRIIRNADGLIQAIVEEKDATIAERAINEIYSGICCASANDLRRWLPQLKKQNAQGEYYLTEIISLAVREGQQLPSIFVKNLVEIQGVNSRLQLHELERLLQKGQAYRLLAEGVHIVDASRFDLRGQLTCGQDVFIDVNCVFIGRVILGDGCQIGPNCVLKDVILGESTEVFAHSVIEGSQLGANCRIGPFARLRAGTVLDDDCKVGNFVETKKVTMGKGTKASHLSYLGDAVIGRSVNIGAGTITCNYDGVNKYETIIEDEVFIGSGVKLVAPVEIGANATVGAGALILKDVPADELTITETKQRTVTGWKRLKKS